MTSLYDKLGVGKDASTEEIKSAYRKRVRKSHPDVGGDPDEFKEVTQAYEILVTEETRKRYDQTGSAEKPELNWLEATVAELASQEFANPKGDPIKRMRVTAANKRDEAKHASENLRKASAKLQKRIDQFHKQNAKTKNIAGKDLILQVLGHTKRSIEAAISDAEEWEAKWQSVLEFLNDLACDGEDASPNRSMWPGNSWATETVATAAYQYAQRCAAGGGWGPQNGQRPGGLDTND